jgi:hypothetical protein
LKAYSARRQVQLFWQLFARMIAFKNGPDFGPFFLPVHTLSYLKERGIEAAAAVSRNDLFEYFIYKKLELEDRKLNADKRAITKRVLEKLALTMELYQTNFITKDDLRSDLKVAAVAQVGAESFTTTHFSR